MCIEEDKSLATCLFCYTQHKRASIIKRMGKNSFEGYKIDSETQLIFSNQLRFTLFMRKTLQKIFQNPPFNHA